MVMRRAAGYSYMTVLFVVAIMGVGLALVGEVWHTAALREKEAELLFVGNQYRRAITLYYENTAAADKPACPAKCYPEKLEDLLEDKRHPAKKRYLRKLYPDPLTGKVDWQLIKVGEAIMGVHSKSGLTPIKTSGFRRERDREFEGANHFSDWKFLHKLPPPQTPPPAQKKPSSTTGAQAPFTAPPGTPLQPPAQSMGAPAAR